MGGQRVGPGPGGLLPSRSRFQEFGLWRAHAALPSPELAGTPHQSQLSPRPALQSRLTGWLGWARAWASVRLSAGTRCAQAGRHHSAWVSMPQWPDQGPEQGKVLPRFTQSLAARGLGAVAQDTRDQAEPAGLWGALAVQALFPHLASVGCACAEPRWCLGGPRRRALSSRGRLGLVVRQPPLDGSASCGCS